MHTKHALMVVGLLGFAGLALSLYLTVAPNPGFCDITSFVSCDRVLTSPYARLLGIPTSLYGAAWFAAISTAAFLPVERRAVLGFIKGWSVLGLVGVGALVYVELVLINAVCLLCTVAHMLAILVAATTFLFIR